MSKNTLSLSLSLSLLLPAFLNDKPNNETKSVKKIIFSSSKRSFVKLFWFEHFFSP